jgi:guanine nucleotide-binding protein alpha-1 subunit
MVLFDTKVITLREIHNAQKYTDSFFSSSFYNLFTFKLCLDFRMRYARAEWEKERNSWRSVVQLNVVRSIITILNVIEAEMNGHTPADCEDGQVALNGDNKVEVLKFTDHHQLLMIRLAPLLGVETELRRRLGAGSEQVPPALNSMSATPFDTPSGYQLRRKPEVSVPSWKDVLDSSGRPVEISPNIQDTVTSVLAGCKEDMKALWHDKAVRLALWRHRLRLFDSAGLYGSHLFLHSRC